MCQLLGPGLGPGGSRLFTILQALKVETDEYRDLFASISVDRQYIVYQE